MIFQNRKDAGRILSTYLMAYKKKKEALVLGLARGGVLVASEIAKILSLPLNAVVPRKIGAPENPELAIGALAEDGEMFFNRELIDLIDVAPAFIAEEVKQEQKIAKERLSRYRQVAPLQDLKDKTILLVDDGIATGATMQVEIQSLRKQKVKRIIAAVPVASREGWKLIKKMADDVVCPHISDDFLGISGFYQEFAGVDDETVIAILQQAQTWQ